MSNFEWRKSETTGEAQRGPSSFVLRFLDPIPNRVHLGKLNIPEPLASPSQLVFQLIESRDKFVRGALQRAFRVDFAFPRQINECEEHVANLVLDSRDIFGRDSLFRFAKFFFDF